MKTPPVVLLPRHHNVLVKWNLNNIRAMTPTPDAQPFPLRLLRGKGQPLLAGKGNVTQVSVPTHRARQNLIKKLLRDLLDEVLAPGAPACIEILLSMIALAN
jgi:hypothetical protein